MKRIEVLFENGDCLVLNKPAGLAVQGGKGVGSSLDRILEAEFVPRPLLVHRLDQDTSGLILAAKHREAAARFSALFAPGGKAAGRIRKIYLAVCAGIPASRRGIIRLPLETRGGARESATGYRVLGSLPLPGEPPAGIPRELPPETPEELSPERMCSRLELELETGRTHQIRRHLAYTGRPVLGDDKYGDFALNKSLRKSPGLRRLLLHAFRLQIPENLAGFAGGIDIRAPLPDYFAPFGPWPG
jgi:23S rRNA pseudouridine955/2504/2580 synthase